MVIGTAQTEQKLLAEKEENSKMDETLSAEECEEYETWIKIQDGRIKELLKKVQIQNERDRNSEARAVDYFFELCLTGNVKQIESHVVKRNIDIRANNNKAVTLAVCVDSVELLQYLYSKGASLVDNNYEAVVTAVKYARSKILDWIYDKQVLLNMKRDKRFTLFAAKYGHLHILKWLVSKGCEIDEDVLEEAVKTGFYPIVRYIIKNGKEKSLTKELAFVFATKHNQTYMMKIFLNDFEMNKKSLCEKGEIAFHNAISNGNIDIVRMLYGSNRFTITNRHIFIAANKSYDDVVEYLLTMGVIYKHNLINFSIHQTEINEEGDRSLTRVLKLRNKREECALLLTYKLDNIINSNGFVFPLDIINLITVYYFGSDGRYFFKFTKQAKNIFGMIPSAAGEGNRSNHSIERIPQPPSDSSQLFPANSNNLLVGENAEEDNGIWGGMGGMLRIRRGRRRRAGGTVILNGGYQRKDVVLLGEGRFLIGRGHALTIINHFLTTDDTYEDEDSIRVFVNPVYIPNYVPPPVPPPSPPQHLRNRTIGNEIEGFRQQINDMKRSMEMDCNCSNLCTEKCECKCGHLRPVAYDPFRLLSIVSRHPHLDNIPFNKNDEENESEIKTLLTEGDQGLYDQYFMDPNSLVNKRENSDIKDPKG